MDADLEMVIRDKTILLSPGDVKAYSLMMLQVSKGLNTAMVVLYW